MLNFLIEIKEVLLVLATGIVSYFIAMHTTKSNAKNLGMQLQHDKALKTNQIKIDKLENAIVNIRLVYKDLNLLSLKLIGILETNTPLEVYKQEIRVDDVLDLQDNVQQIAVSLEIYAFHISKQTTNLIKNAQELAKLLLPKNNMNDLLTVENVIMAKNNFHESTKDLTIAITSHIRSNLL